MKVLVGDEAGYFRYHVIHYISIFLFSLDFISWLKEPSFVYSCELHSMPSV